MYELELLSEHEVEVRAAGSRVIGDLVESVGPIQPQKAENRQENPYAGSC